MNILEPVFTTEGCRMDEDFSRQTRRFSAAILTYGKGNRRSMAGKRTARRRAAVVNTGSYNLKRETYLMVVFKNAYNYGKFA
jgi:hypothetical protein